MAGEFPVQFSQRTISGQAGAVRANLDVDTGSQMIGRAASQLGGTIFDLGMKIQETRNKVDLSTKQREVDEKSNALLVTLETTYDKETRDKLISQWESDIDKVQGENEWVNRELQGYKDRVTPDWQRTFAIKGLVIEKDNAIADIQINADADINRGDLGSALKQADLLREVGVEQTRVNAYKDALTGQFNKIQTEKLELKIKSEYQAVIDKGGTKEQAYKVIDSYAANGMINPEQKEKLGNNLDNYTEGRIKKAATEKAMRVMESYKDLSRKLLTTDGITYEEVEAADFDEKGKKIWDGAIKGSFAPVPQETTKAGFTKALDSVLSVSTRGISKQTAYNELLKARFIDRTINNDTYLWAITRLENQYPKHVATTLDGIVKASESFFYHKGVGVFGKDFIDDKEEAQLVKAQGDFMDWVETESKDGKYPDGRVMYGKIRELGVTVKTPPNLPASPMVTPKSTDSNYIDSQEKYNKLEPGVSFYDALTRRWMMKPFKKSTEGQKWKLDYTEGENGGISLGSDPYKVF